MEGQQAGPNDNSGTVRGRRTLALIALLGAAFMGILDSFIVVVAGPSIEASLHATKPQLQLIFVAYVTTYAGVLILGGRLGDRFGHRNVFLIGVSGFTVASVLCASAPGAMELVADRILQAVFAALMVPQVLVLLQSMYPQPRERAAALGWYTAAIGLAAVSGQLLGGALIGIGGSQPFAWRAIFLVNVPIGLFAVVLGVARLGTNRPNPGMRVDTGGGVLQFMACSLLLAAVMLLASGFSWKLSAVTLTAAVLTMAAFARLERKVEASGRAALVPMSMLANPRFALPLAAILVTYVTAGLNAIGSYYLQAGHQLAPLTAGLLYMPTGIAFTVGSALSGGFLARFGPRIAWVCQWGCAGVLACLPGAITLSPPPWQPYVISAISAAFGLLQGNVAGPLLGLGMKGAGPQTAGAAAGVLLTGIQLSSAVGLALLMAVFFEVLGAAHDLGAFNRALQYPVYLSVPLLVAGGFLIRRALAVAPTLGPSVRAAGMGSK